MYPKCKYCGTSVDTDGIDNWQKEDDGTYHHYDCASYHDPAQ